MKGKLFIVLGLLIVLGIVLFFVLFHKPKKDNDTLVLYGNVDIRQVDLGFRVFGRVQNLLFEEGDELKPGQLMAVLDKVPYEEQVWQARANVMAIAAELANAEIKFKRRNDVVPAAISREDYDDALYNMEKLKGDLEAAEAQLATNLTNLEDTQIFCPTEGTILTRIREPGSVVNVGEPVYTLSIKSPVWIRAYVSEPNLGRIYPGMPADVSTDTPGSPVYRGCIGFISPVAEFTPKNVETTDLRTDLVYRLRIYIENVDNGLRQGMPVTVKLDTKAVEKECRKQP
jgi:HlyD family secretion protein